MTPDTALAKERVALARAAYIEAADKRRGDSVDLFNRYSRLLHEYRLAHRDAKEAKND